MDAPHPPRNWNTWRTNSRKFAHPAQCMLADLHELDSIGSVGLGFIVQVFKSATKRPGGRFMLAGANSRVRRALEVTRLSEVIPMADDVTSGLRALRSAATAAGKK
jgi:anti-anti-sigma factor